MEYPAWAYTTMHTLPPTINNSLESSLVTRCKAVNFINATKLVDARMSDSGRGTQKTKSSHPASIYGSLPMAD